MMLPMTHRMRVTVTFAVIVVLAFAAVLFVTTQANGAPGKPDVPKKSQPGEQSLSQAVVGHGPAAGEKPLQAGRNSHSGVDAAAAGVNEGTKKQAGGVQMHSLDSLGDPATGSTGSGGCVVGYGQGKQCLPVVPPSHAEHADHDMSTAWACQELITLFPKGIKVNSKADGTTTVDPLRLDKNGNGTACDLGDML